MQVSKDLSQLLLSSDSLKALSKSSGASQPQVKKIVSAALPIMLSGMKTNAKSDKSGAKSLLTALNSHSGDDISDISSFFSAADADDGDKIVSHVLGGSKQNITKALASKSGATKGEVGSILALLAPALLTAVGNQASSSNTSASGLDSLLGTLMGSSSNSSNDDDDGVGLDDIASILLGSSGSGSGSGSVLGSLLGSSSNSSSSSSSSGSGNLLNLLLNVFGDDD